jgi:hypothetical protein
MMSPNGATRNREALHDCVSFIFVFEKTLLTDHLFANNSRPRDGQVDYRKR